MPNYLVVLEPSSTGYAAFSPDVPGCVATGKTVEETLSEMRLALIFHLEDMAETGEAPPFAQGLEHHLHSGEYTFDKGDLLTLLPVDFSRAKDPASILAKA